MIDAAKPHSTTSLAYQPVLADLEAAAQKLGKDTTGMKVQPSVPVAPTAHITEPTESPSIAYTSGYDPASPSITHTDMSFETQSTLAKLRAATASPSITTVNSYTVRGDAFGSTVGGDTFPAPQHGKPSLDSYKHEQQPRQSLRRDDAVEIFQQIDANGDCEISQIEFIKTLRKDGGLPLRLGLPHEIHQEDEIRKLFALTYADIDKDHSKSISLEEEFLAYYQKPPTVSMQASLFSSPPVRSSRPEKQYAPSSENGAHATRANPSFQSSRPKSLSSHSPSYYEPRGPASQYVPPPKTHWVPRQPYKYETVYPLASEFFERSTGLTQNTADEPPGMGLGMLLENTYLENTQGTKADPISHILFSPVDIGERVWRIKSMQAGYGAATSGQLMIGDIVTRVDGHTIDGIFVSTVH